MTNATSSGSRSGWPTCERKHRMTRIAICAFASLAWIASAAAAAPPTLDQPSSGWREAPAQQRDFVQEVHYPAASVNTIGKSAAAIIRGRVAAAPKARDGDARKPARLIVDGVALPLLTAEDGSFERPWSFGSGSHGVEVRAADGSRKRRQFYEAQANRAPTKLRVVLSWDSDNTDLDLHVVSPDGQHVFYGDRVGNNGGVLDVDVTTGFGPEIYASPSPLRGIYHVYVNYYGAGEQRDAITVAQVAIVTDEGTAREKQEVLRVPMRKPGELTLVRSFVMP